MVRPVAALAVVVLLGACMVPQPGGPSGGVSVAGVGGGGGGYGEIGREQARLQRLSEARHREYQERVARVGRRLLETMPDPPRVQFVVAAGSRDINAGATFGQVIVTSGILDFARNDDELAAVLSHELAHLTQGHVTKGLIGSLAVKVLAIVVESQAPGLGNVAGGAGQLALNRYTQSQERAADRVGIEYMYGAGYDPSAAATVQERLAVEVPQTMTAGFFDTHPSSVERMLTARKQAAELLAKGPPPGRAEVLAMERRAIAARPDRGRLPDADATPPPATGRGYRREPAPVARGGGDEAPASLDCRRADTYRRRADDAASLEEAESLYRRALRYCPDLAAAREGLADVLRRSGRGGDEPPPSRRGRGSADEPPPDVY